MGSCANHMATPVIADLGTPRRSTNFSTRPARRKVPRSASPSPGGVRRAHPPSAGPCATSHRRPKTFITTHPRRFRHAARQTQPDSAPRCSFFLATPSRFLVSKKLEKIQPRFTPERSSRVARASATCWRATRFHDLMQNSDERSSRRSAALAQLCSDDSVPTGASAPVFRQTLIKRKIWQHPFVDLYTKVKCSGFVYKSSIHYNEEVLKKSRSRSIRRHLHGEIAAGDLPARSRPCLSSRGGYIEISIAPPIAISAFAHRRGTSEVLRYYWQIDGL